MAELLADFWHCREEYRSKQEIVTDLVIIMDVKQFIPEKKISIERQF